ncbi:MAG: nucleotide-binding domain containing protein, partial [Bacillota bacterium]
GLEAHFQEAVDGEIFCPYFREGGRYTLDNVHYVADGDTLVPAAETEYAKDRTFGYAHSDLREYVEEKTRGAYRAKDVQSVSLQELRALDFDGITAKLCALRGFGKLIVNAADDYDLKVFCVALYSALAKGKRFCCRTAASFVKIVANIADRPPLAYGDMIPEDTRRGGIVLVGSHTQKTTAQLFELLTLSQAEAVELDSDLVLTPGALEAETERVIGVCDGLIAAGTTPVVFTKRTALILPGDTPETALERSVRISQAVQAVVAGLSAPPAFIVAKGGITASDIATKALRVRRAEVLGQISPGVPVWKTGAESRFPGIPYVIFPGNVGQTETLREIAQVLLRGKA